MQIRFRWKLSLVVLLALSGALAFRGCFRQVPVKPTPSQVLPSGDLAKVLVEKHKVTTTTQEGTKTQYVPSAVTVEVTKTGKVNITVKETGFEYAFFTGVQVSDEGRICAGLDLWYFNKLDLGLGVAAKPGMTTPIAFAKASWIVHQFDGAQLELGLTYDNLQHAGLALTVKI